MSYKYEVSTKGSWGGNALRFATEKEADEAGRELLSRWWVPDGHRVVESPDPVNEVFNFTTGRPEPLPKAALSAEAVAMLEECGV